MSGLGSTTFNQVPRTGHPMGGTQRLGPYGTGPHYQVSTPWAIDHSQGDGRCGSGSLLGPTSSQVASPHQGLTCEKFGDQTFLRGNRETVDIEALRETILQRVHPENLYLALQVFDPDRKGTITAAQFRRTADAIMPGVPSWASAQMMLLGIGGDGLFSYQGMMRALGFVDIIGPSSVLSKQGGSNARAAGTSGDIIAHRDDTEFETTAPIPAGRVSRSRGAATVAATTSGDIIGHTSPIRSADLAWDMKGRVFSNKDGTVLDYANANYNCVHDAPGKFNSYRNNGDIIANTDYRMEGQRKLFDTKRSGPLHEGNKDTSTSSMRDSKNPLC